MYDFGELAWINLTEVTTHEKLSSVNTIDHHHLKHPEPLVLIETEMPSTCWEERWVEAVHPWKNRGAQFGHFVKNVPHYKVPPHSVWEADETIQELQSAAVINQDSLYS